MHLGDNDAPTGVVTVNGTATEDQVLTAVSSTLADADGLGTLHYQWQRDSGTGFGNVGLDQATYTLGDADVGATVRVVMSYTDGHGTAEAVTSAATATIANVNEAPTGTVTLNGTATEDQVLAAVTSTLADADGLGTPHYQWQRDSGTGFGNVGLDQASYTLAAADVGTAVRVVVSYTDGHGTAEAVTSAAIAAVAGVNHPPTITSNGGGDTAAVSVAENTTAVTTVTATDPDAGQTLSYSIIGGADAAKFTIARRRARFRSSPRRTLKHRPMRAATMSTT